MKQTIPTMDLTASYGAGIDACYAQRILFNENSDTENQVINLYPDRTYEVFEGFGGAITDGAGYNYSLMDEEQKELLITTYFLPERMNYQFVRIPIDSCDFSLGQYEAMSDPEDRELKSFSFARTEKYIIPMLRDAEKAAGKKIPVMLTPWSPPAFMKTNGKREGGGFLKEEYRDFWADYICRYIREFRDRGFLVNRISIQNEAKAVQTWDSCIFSAKEEGAFLRDHLHPALVRNGMEDIEVFIWDHNKERIYERMRDTITPDIAPLITGAACHWYSGDHFEALDLCREQFPDKKLIVSESCIEFSKYRAEDSIGAAMMLCREMIEDLAHGVVAFYDWNLLVNERGGPNYVENNVLAPFLYDRQRKLLCPQLLQKYYEHISHHLLPGSLRIAATRYTDVIKVTAWRRPDGQIAVFLLNSAETPQTAVLRIDGCEASVVLYPQSILSGLIVK